jgi:hypothetical protein
VSKLFKGVKIFTPMPMLKHIKKRLLLCSLMALLMVACSMGPIARTFNSPLGNRLILNVPFHPDDTNLCGPASLAALLTYSGYPTTVEEAENAVKRWNLRGAIGADLAIYARDKGADARFYSSTPEFLLEHIEQKEPVLVEVDNGIGPLVKAHFMLVVGYSPEGVVANNGLVQQEIIPWSKFLTAWYKMGYFALVVKNKEKPASDGEESPEAAEGEAS